jgi:hypothetical protein
MHMRFGLNLGVNGKKGTCVSSVFNPHTGLQQCPTCYDLGDVGMQCPASHPVCCVDQRCVQTATQCTCNHNEDCPQGTCCNGNLRASIVAPILMTAGDIRAFAQNEHVLYYLALGSHLCCLTIPVILLYLLTFPGFRVFRV